MSKHDTQNYKERSMTLPNLTLAQATETCNLFNLNAKNSEETKGTDRNNIPCIWNYQEEESSSEFLSANNNKKTDNKKPLTEKMKNSLTGKIKKHTAYWTKFKQIINGMGFKLKTEAMFEKFGKNSKDGLIYEDAYNNRQSFSDKSVKAMFEKAKQETDKQMGYSAENAAL